MLPLLLQALTVSLVDIDNAMYTTDQVSELEERQGLANVLAVAIEFAGRLLLLLLFSAVAGMREPLFQVQGQAWRLDHVALLAAGVYLLASNGREVAHAMRTPLSTVMDDQAPPPRSFALHLAKMGLVLTLLSVDTILLVLNMTQDAGQIFFFLLFSAALRLLFVDRLVALIDRFPAISLFINGLLILIGLELIIQALGLDFERQFNAILLLLILGVTGYIALVNRRLRT